MNFDAFEKALRLIAGSYIDDDDSVIDELLDDCHDLVREYDYPFCKELNINLLKAESKEGKTSIIKYYIHEFKDPFGLFLSNKELFVSESDMSVEEYNKHIDEGRFDLLPKSVPRNFNRVQQYIIKANELFCLLFDEIQSCCNKYEIDIWKVCEDIDFPIEFCCTGITASFIDDRNEHKRAKGLANLLPTDKDVKSDIINSQEKSLSSEPDEIQFNNSKVSKTVSKEGQTLQHIPTLVKLKLKEMGFFELKKIKLLSNNNISAILEEIYCNDLPYKIAMLDFLGFIEQNEKNYYMNKGERNKDLAELFETTPRNVKGNILVLSKVSKENRNRYTAHNYMETVKIFYQNLK